MHRLLRETAHRPWPLPRRGWAWRQSWLDLAFVHYRVDPAQLRQRLPAGLQLQEFDGSAWVGLVPFRMAGVTRRPLPSFPQLSSFHELNLRTYVEADGRPGVWFLSLDADSRLAVLGGRRFYGVPYFHARITQVARDGWFEYSCARRGGGAIFRGRYRPVGGPFIPARGSFGHWAAERYCLYSNAPGGGLARVDVHHAPWPLQEAEVEIRESSMLAAAGIVPAEGRPRSHFSTGVDVLTYSLEEMPERSNDPGHAPAPAPAAREPGRG
jgi:uncharacterized protein YqjF (DUF2071 family)